MQRMHNLSRSHGVAVYPTHGSRRRKVRIRPLVRGLKAQHDVLAGHAEVDQFVGDAVLRAVALHPDFLALEVDVDQAGVDAPVAVPADVHEVVVALGVVEEELGVEFLRHAGVGIGGVLLDDLTDEGAVMGGFGYGIHAMMWGWTGSKTMRLTTNQLPS